VISGGAVSEAGTHSELMALDRIYAALYRTQFETQPT
jgi:ABC-type multidrug transport system fused ATPase/permease subunit